MVTTLNKCKICKKWHSDNTGSVCNECIKKTVGKIIKRVISVVKGKKT